MTRAVGILALLVACTSHSVRTTAEPVHPVTVNAAGPRPTDSVAPGTIRGVVVDDSTGRGLDGVDVLVVRERTDVARGAATDSLGRFRFRFAPLDSLTLQVLRMGYMRQAIPLRLDPSRGYTIVLTLSTRPSRVTCDRPPGPEPAVILSVRDALSGHAPASATVKITAPGYRDSVTMAPAPGDSALVFRLGTYGYFHTYSLVVQSPGFRDWRVDDATEVRASCGAFVFPLQQVWLLPK